MVLVWIKLSKSNTSLSIKNFILKKNPSLHSWFMSTVLLSFKAVHIAVDFQTGWICEQIYVLINMYMYKNKIYCIMYIYICILRDKISGGVFVCLLPKVYRTFKPTFLIYVCSKAVWYDGIFLPLYAK